MSEMAGNHEAVSVLAPLLRSNGEPYPQTLFGAGPAFRFGVPTAAGAVRRTARVARILNASTNPAPGYHSEHPILKGVISRAKQGGLHLAERHLLLPASWRKADISSWCDVKRDVDFRPRCRSCGIVLRKPQLVRALRLGQSQRKQKT